MPSLFTQTRSHCEANSENVHRDILLHGAFCEAPYQFKSKLSPGRSRHSNQTPQVPDRGDRATREQVPDRGDRATREQFTGLYNVPEEGTHSLGVGTELETTAKEGRFLRNFSTAPICDLFTVVTPGSWIREVGLFNFRADHLGCDRCIHVANYNYFHMCPTPPPKITHSQ